MGATTRRRSRRRYDRRRDRGAVLGSRHGRPTHRLAPAHRRHAPVRCAPPLRRWRSRALAAATCRSSDGRTFGGGWSGAPDRAGPDRARSGRHDRIERYPSSRLINGSSSRRSARPTGSTGARHAGASPDSGRWTSRAAWPAPNTRSPVGTRAVAHCTARTACPDASTTSLPLSAAPQRTRIHAFNGAAAASPDTHGPK